MNAPPRTAQPRDTVPFSPGSIRFERVERSRFSSVDLADVPFGTVFSDHMLVAEFEDGTWSNATLRPYGALPLPPNISALQYGISIFEGLKAHRSPTGEALLFRPADNARRINRSAARLAMPEVPEALFLEGLRALVRLDERWIPAAGTGALYIRPCLFSVDGSLRVKPADRFLFVILASPFASYFAAPVDVLVTERYVRAFPGGAGDVKPSGNYAPALLADREAQQAGCGTVLWLDGREHRYVEECGVMNVFFVIDRGGGPTVVTPELGGTILPGITRDSVIALLHEAGIPLEQRRIAIDELVELHQANRLRECFGTGTAVTVSHIGSIRYRDQTLLLPPVEERTVAPAVRERLVAIASGRAADPFGWVERVTS